MMEHGKPLDSPNDRPFVPLPHTVFEQPTSGAAGVVAQGEITVPGSGTLEAAPAIAQSDSMALPPLSWLETVTQTEVIEVTKLSTVTDVPQEHIATDDDNEACWQIDQSMADSLVAELSIATPEMQREIAQTVSRAKTIYERDYGAFMQPEFIQAAVGVEQRIIIVEPDTFDAFCNNWQQDNSEIPSNVSAGFTPIGNVIAFKDPVMHWDAFSAADQQQSAEILGGAEEAEALVCRTTLDYTATHELAHQYEANDTPVAFSELGACYYQKTVTLQDGRRCTPNTDVDQRAAFYESLLDIYGDDVHRVFFGTLNNPERRALILSHLTPENVKKLYLNGDGWGHEKPERA